MSILSGYKKFKKYLKTTDGYQLISYFTSSDTVNMVDENGNITDTTLTESISQAGKGRELTQAEYDALSEAEKKNGTVYYITDDDGVVSVVALTREAYDALGDVTSTDGRIYLITDENMEETAKNIAFDDSNTAIDATTVHEAIEAIDTQLTNKSIAYSTLLNKKHISGNVRELVSMSDELTKYKFVSFIFYWNNTTVRAQQTYPGSCFGGIIQNVVLYGGNEENIIQVWPKDSNSIYVQMADNDYISLSIIAWN